MARRSGPIGMTLAAPPAPDRRPPAAAIPPGQRRRWFNMVDRGPHNAARIDIYEEIGGWGVSAAEFAEALRAVDADAIDLHINSPGGSVFDGLTIFNALVAHPATVTVYVDGLAASAASFIAQAGDVVVMNRGSMMMLHDAIALTWGNSFAHRDSADLLDKVGVSIAGVYASRAGGTAADWAAVMGEKNGEGRWYTADEAVEAGLADRVAGASDRTEQQGADPVEQQTEDPQELFDKSSIAAGARLVQVQRENALAALAAMPTAGPVCATCGGPFHPVCPSAPKVAEVSDTAWAAFLAYAESEANSTTALPWLSGDK